MAELIDEKVLADYDEERERNRVMIALGSSFSCLHDRKDEIEKIFDENKRAAAWEQVMVILCTEIELSVKGRVIVPEYSQKGSAKQTIYVFIGTHWEVVPIQMYYDFIKECCRRIGLPEVFVQNFKYMNAIFEQVAFIVSHHISTAQPHEGVYINLKNCTAEISVDGTITAREHRAEDFFLYCLPYNYDPEAECPRWHKFLDEVLPEKEAQQLLGEYIGYCFTQNLKLEKMAVFYGGGANGKSVCLDVIKRLFGRSNVSEATLSSVTTDPEARCLLENKLVNISSESGKNLDAAILKMLISGETVEMRKLYVGTKQLYNPPKLITSYNVLPPLENTHGYRRRWLLFPFNVTIPDEKQDPALANKLALELPGIMNWVAGHLAHLMEKVNRFKGEDFVISKICNNALDDYFKSANTAMMFLNDCCSKQDVLVPLKELYAQYVNYCKCNGITKPCILKNFKIALQEWGAEETVKLQVKYYNVYVDRSVYE